MILPCVTVKVPVGDAYLEPIFASWAGHNTGPWPIRTLAKGDGATAALIYRVDGISPHWRLIKDVIFRFLWNQAAPHLKVRI